MASKQKTATQVKPPKRLTSYQSDVVCTPWYTADGKRAQISTFEKARRIGGSTAAAIRSLMLMSGRELRPDGTFIQREPMDVHVVSKDFLGSKNLIREIGEAAEELAPLDPDLRCDIQATTVRMRRTGRVANALPCSAAACRSNTGSVCMDEVAFWRQPEEVYAAAKIIADPNLRESRGYPITMVTTPWDSGSLAHRLFTDDAYPFVRYRVDIYDAVKAGFPIDPERARQELGIPELFASEYECRWSIGGDSFFPLAKLRDAQEDELPKGWQDWPIFIGGDVGGVRGRDNTCLVMWRQNGSDVWMTGLKAWNQVSDAELGNRTRLEWQADEAAEWVLASATMWTPVTIAVDRGIMGADFIDALKKRLKDKLKHLTVVGVGMMPADQERYAKAARRTLENGSWHIYTGTEAGGDESGSRALMLELSQLKSRPGTGGHLTFATPRDPSRGHCDRAWAALIGLSKAAPEMKRADRESGSSDRISPTSLIHETSLDDTSLGFDGLSIG